MNRLVILFIHHHGTSLVLGSSGLYPKDLKGKSKIFGGWALKDDPAALSWDGDLGAKYESLNYGKSLAAYVLRRSHNLLEKAFDPSVHFPRVLELGAGTGVHYDFVRHSFDEYWMTDASERMVGHCASRYSHSIRVKALQADALRLNFESRSFDRVIAAHLLEHLVWPQKVLREWFRVLRPGGVLSLVLPCDPGLLWRFGRYFGPRRRALSRGVECDFMMAAEHVNSIYNLTTFIRYYFDDVQNLWWPSLVPFPDLNLFYVVHVRNH